MGSLNLISQTPTRRHILFQGSRQWSLPNRPQMAIYVQGKVFRHRPVLNQKQRYTPNQYTMAITC